MNRKEEKLLLQAIIEILEYIRCQPNSFTQKRLVRELSHIAYAVEDKGESK